MKTPPCPSILQILHQFGRGRRSRLTAKIMLLASTVSFAPAAIVDWEGATGGTPGDGLFWSDPFNWQTDNIPLAADNVTFGAPGTGGSTVHLDANRTVADLSFDENITLGAFGNNLALTNTSGNINVTAGVLAKLNARLLGTNGLNLSGGGTLHVTNLFNGFTGNINVSGAGTRLQVAYPGQPTPANRSNVFPLGQTNRTITLSNGGEFRLLGSGYNPDGSVKDMVLGSNGSAINVAAGYQQMIIDDAAQIAVAGGAVPPSLIKNGNGRFTINTQAYNLAANLTVNAGLIDFAHSAASTVAVAGGQPNRFTAFTGLGFNAGATTTITLNGGMLVGNNGTTSQIDVPTIIFNGGTFAPRAPNMNWAPVLQLPRPFRQRRISPSMPAP